MDRVVFFFVCVCVFFKVSFLAAFFLFYLGVMWRVGCLELCICLWWLF